MSNKTFYPDLAREPNEIRQIELHYKHPVTETMPIIGEHKSILECIYNCINYNRNNLYSTLWIVLLNNENRLLGLSEIALGHKATQMDHLVYGLRTALLAKCNRVVLAHGIVKGEKELTAEQADIDFAHMAKSIFNSLRIELVDYEIFKSQEGSISFRSLSLL